MAENNRILLIHDDEVNAKYLIKKLMLEGGYAVSHQVSAQGGLEVFKKGNFDLVLAKFDLPDLPAAELIKGLKKIEPTCVIMLLIKDTDLNLIKAVSELGIYDSISLPINLERLFFLVKKGIELHTLTISHTKLVQILKEQNISLQKQNILLAKRIEESTKNLSRLYDDLRTTYMHTIKVLAQVIDARDHYTHSHSENVSRYAVAIAKEMHLSTHEIEMIKEACELHDLGKIGIGDSILSKTSSLNGQEWEVIKRHPLIAVQILEPLTFLDGVIELIRQHHEYYDGGGYPRGLQGEDILLGARIIHLADAYEAMRASRSYRKTPLSKEEAILEIKRKSGSQFDPKVVTAFLRVVDKLE